MKLIKELLNLNEANEADNRDTKDLKDIVKYFPNNTQKAVDAVNSRLTYNGEKIFGDFYSKIDKAASKALVGEKFELNLGNLVNGRFPTKKGGTAELDVEYVEVEIEEGQEVYLGYVPNRDYFVMGFDSFLNEDDFWQALQKEANKQKIDTESQQYDKMCSKIWKYLNNSMGMNITFEIKIKGSKIDVFHIVTQEDTFYGKKGNYKQLKTLYPGIIDIRLD